MADHKHPHQSSASVHDQRSCRAAMYYTWAVSRAGWSANKSVQPAEDQSSSLLHAQMRFLDSTQAPSVPLELDKPRIPPIPTNLRLHHRTAMLE